MLGRGGPKAAGRARRGEAFRYRGQVVIRGGAGVDRSRQRALAAFPRQSASSGFNGLSAAQLGQTAADKSRF